MTDSDPKQLVCGVDLTLQTATATIEITTSDGHLFVDADSISALRELYGLHRSVDSTANNWLTAITAASDSVVLRVPVVICVDGTPIARYDPTDSSRLLRLVGTSLRPDLGGVARTAIRWFAER